jgi:hypothetical protein
VDEPPGGRAVRLIDGGWRRLTQRDHDHIAATDRNSRRRGWRGLLDRLHGHGSRLW